MNDAVTASVQYTVRVDSLPHRKLREIQQQPGTAGPGNMLGCCLIYFHFLWGKLSTRTVMFRGVHSSLVAMLRLLYIMTHLLSRKVLFHVFLDAPISKYSLCEQ